MEKSSQNSTAWATKRKVEAVGAGENGAIMVIVLIVLVLLTLAGISATNTSVTESFIVRNTAIHMQNLQLAEMAAMEGLREILTRNDPPDLVPGAHPPGLGGEAWLRDISTWNNDPTINDPDNDNNFPLTDNNSTVALVDTIDIRGETDDEPLRYYFIGWRDAPLSSLVMTATMWRQGRVVAIYNSEDYGRASVELGVIKRF